MRTPASHLVSFVIPTLAALLLTLAPDALATTCRTRMNLTATGQFKCTVSANAVSVTFTAVGGAGGQNVSGPGPGADAPGMGDRVQATFALGPGGPLALRQTVYFEVGGNGESNGLSTRPGANGGGAPNGGGASDVRTTPVADGLFPDPRLLVAGGGGGAGAGAYCGNSHCGASGGGGGNAGFPSGSAGGPSCAILDPTFCTSGGGGGSQTSGGASGGGGAAPGARGQGGRGDSTAGGGGGGYFGGGGGAGGIVSGSGAGGGGGSDYVGADATSVSQSPSPKGPSITVSFVLAGAYAPAQRDRMSPHGLVAVRTICRATNQGACTGTVRLLYGRAQLGTGTFTISSGGSRPVSLRLSSRGRTLVRQHGRLTTRTIVSSRGPNGSQLQQTSTVTLLASTTRPPFTG